MTKISGNTINRHQMMTDALAETYQLDVQIKAAVDKYVRPLRKSKREIKSQLNEDLNITATVFNARYASYRLEGQATGAEDQATLDSLKELFEVSPIGAQLDWIAAVEDSGAAAA